jgi:acyl-coenzyme A synthetase/AMP-(fatty) acid ligase
MVISRSSAPTQDQEVPLMWHRFFTGRGFHLGDMFHQAATRRGSVRVTLDRPLDAAAGTGLDHTYRTMAGLIEELAAQLWAAGVRPTERVAVYKSDNFDIVLLTCALSRIGAVPALLSPTLDAPVVAELVRRLERPWLLTDHAKLTGALTDSGVGELSRQVLVVGADAEHAAATIAGVPLAKFAGAPRVRPVRLDVREPSLITHSSGTTGIPKLAVHCANALWNRLLPQKLLGWPTRGETAAVCMSYVHSRFYHALGVFLHYGSPLLALVDHEPASVGPLLAKARPGIVETHPNTFVLWEDLADAPGAPLSNVRSYGSTFDAIHPRTVRRLLDASTRRGAWLIQLYGQSETGPVAARMFTRRGAAKENGRLVGIGLPGFTRVRVVDDQGVPCPPGVQGHIEARTRGRILTYLGAAEHYDRQLHDDWWRMGDMGAMGRWATLYLVDREVDQIDTVDSNLELEDVLMSRLEELREVVIVPGATGQPIPVICTRNDEPLPPARWRQAVTGLPELAAPVLCRFDDLPRTGTWKIKRLEIARIFAEGNSLVTNWAAG